MFDLIIENGTIVTVDQTFDIIPDGVIAVNGGVIERISSKKESDRPFRAEKRLDARGGLILPGLINTHTHLPMTLFRGLADDLPLTTWLNDHIFPAEADHINKESVRYGALLGCAEMILSGTTTCCDGYFFEHEVAEAIVESGLRAVLGQGVIDFPAPGVENPQQNIEQAALFIKTWKDNHPTVAPSVFCHSPYTCSIKTLKTAKALADDMDVLFQIHAAETKEEARRMKAEHHQSVIEYLDAAGLLDNRTLLVHAVWIDDRDIRMIADRKAAVSHNPQSNMKLAAGFAPVKKILEASIPMGLGTDGCASNNDLDLFAEMDTAAKIHKGYTGDPTVMDAETVLETATINGARALGLDHAVGSLERGKQADIIVLDTHAPHLTPMYHPQSHIVYAAKGSDVIHVVAAGRILLENRRLLTLDMDDIYRNISRLSSSIKR